MSQTYCVYIMTNSPGGTLYIGMTNNLARRINEHKQGLVDGFTKQYQLHTLVYYEAFETPQEAIRREKQLKEWHRSWKIRLIKTENPGWRDLAGSI